MRWRGYWVAALLVGGAGTFIVVSLSEHDPQPTGRVLVVDGNDHQPKLSAERAHMPPVQSIETQSPKVTMASDAEAIRSDFQDQAVDAKWAARTEAQLIDIFRSGAGVKINAVSCRSSACEIVGELRYLNSANVSDTLERIDGIALNSRLRSSGFEGQKSAEFTVVSNAPLSLSFRKIVKDTGR